MHVRSAVPPAHRLTRISFGYSYRFIDGDSPRRSGADFVQPSPGDCSAPCCADFAVFHAVRPSLEKADCPAEVHPDHRRKQRHWSRACAAVRESWNVHLHHRYDAFKSAADNCEIDLFQAATRADSTPWRARVEWSARRSKPWSSMWWTGTRRVRSVVPYVDDPLHRLRASSRARPLYGSALRASSSSGSTVTTAWTS